MTFSNNIGDDIFNLSSLSFLNEYNDKPANVSTEWVKSIVESILYKRFAEYEKHKIEDYSNRMTFACPYCGDSSIDKTRKRGNLFFDTLGYHCFNCGYHTSLLNIVKNYDIDINNEDMYILKTFKTIAPKKYTMDDILNINLVNKYGLKKEYILNKLDFLPIEKTVAKKYLTERFQKDFENFAYDPASNAIVIFNMNRSNGNIIGFQKRLLNKNVKNRYLSYTLSKIYEAIGLEYDESLDYIDRLSMIFNILNINFNENLTVFEGPFDAFLYGNSVATSGLTKEFPFDSDIIKFWYDNDEPGKHKAKEMLEKGNSVFLWNLYLKDLKIPSYKKIKDLTDLITYTKQNSIKLIPFETYFSSSRLDLFYI